jgi:hypothetical protein
MRCILPAVLLLALLATPILASPDGQVPPKNEGPSIFKSERYALSVRAPGGWKQELERPRSRGSWIDVVSFRDAVTQSYVLVSCQATTYADFEEMNRRLTDLYKNRSDILLMQGPEVRPAVMGLRGPGVYVEFSRTRGKLTERAFLAYFLNGRFTVRMFGVATEKNHKKAQGALQGFLASLRFHSRSLNVAEPNFVHEASGCSLLFPESWTVRVPRHGPVAVFVGKDAGSTIWLYRESYDGDLVAYRRQRMQALIAAGIEGMKAKDPAAHEKRGEPVVVIDYMRDEGTKARRFREVLLVRNEVAWRLVLGASPVAMSRGIPALETMVESLRIP